MNATIKANRKSDNKAELVALASKVLGTIIYNEGKETMDIARQYITTIDFITPELISLASLLWDLNSKGRPLTIEVIGLEYTTTKMNINEFGLLMSYCIDRADINNFEYECRILAQFATAARLDDLYQSALTDLRSGNDPFKVSESLQTYTEIMLESFHQSKSTHIAQVDAMAMIEGMAANKGLLGTTTGFRSLDAALSGFAPSDLIIVGGRPGMGKTALMLCFALAAAGAGQSVAFFSLEMSALQLKFRLLVMMSGVSSGKIRGGHVSESELANIRRASIELDKLPIFIEDSSYTVETITTKAKYMAKFGKVDMILVDYLQLASSERKNGQRYVEVGDVSRGLKRLGKDLDVPIIAGSQLSRDSIGREPTMKDLRETGDIEQDADLIMLIHRQEYYIPKGQEIPFDIKGVAKIIIEKFRHGGTGVEELKFIGHITKFVEDDDGMSDALPFDVDDDGKRISDIPPDDIVPF